MKTMYQKVKHLVIGAAAAGGVAFIQTLEVDGAAIFGTEPWWPLAAAGAGFLIAELGALAKNE